MARKKNRPENEQRADDASRRDERESGMPGSGRGRRDAVGRSGVYPESATERPSRDAPVRTENAWGQGERGAAGYQDSGTSEMASSEEIRRRIERDRQSASQRSDEDQRSGTEQRSGHEQSTSDRRSSDQRSSNDRPSR
jgi:hypothetical protein